MFKVKKRSNSVDKDGDVESAQRPVWPVKSCPKMISLEKLKILTPVQILPEDVGTLGKIIVAAGFEKLPKVQ